MKKVLILSLQGLGNTILFAPILEKLVNDHPETVINLVVSDNGAYQFILPFCEKLGVKCHVWCESARTIHNVAKLALSLRRERFDAVYSTYPSGKRENVLSFLVSAKNRRSIRDETGYYKLLQFLNPDATLMGDGLHDFEKMARLFGVSVSLPRKRLDCRTSKRLIIGVHPGSSSQGKSKRWDIHKFKTTLLRCSKMFNCEIVLFGGHEECDLISQLQSGEYRSRVVIDYPFPKLLEEISACDIFFSNDSSLMHMAAVSGVSVMAVWAYTDFRRVAPLGEGNIVIKSDYDCSSCYGLTTDFIEDCKYHLRCIKDISVNEVCSVMAKWINVLKEGRFPLEKDFLELNCVLKSETLPHGCVVVSLPGKSA